MIEFGLLLELDPWLLPEAVFTPQLKPRLLASLACPIQAALVSHLPFKVALLQSSVVSHTVGVLAQMREELL